MFRAMMDAIQEESVGFLFNLEVQIEGEAEQPAAELAPMADYEPAELDAEGVLAALATPSEADDHPQISAKGLGRSNGSAPLTYSAPALGSETPEVHIEGGAKPEAGSRTSAARQRRGNPNKGSRGNKRKR